MQSKKSSFSRTIFFKNTGSYWPLYVLYTVILFLAMFALTSGPMQEEYYTQQNVLRSIGGAYPVMAMLYATFVALAVNSYLCSTSNAVTIHSLPVTRRALFVTNISSGAAFIVVPNITVFILIAALQFTRGHFGISPLLIWLAACTIQGLFFFSLATFAAHLTGSRLMMPALTLILNFIVVSCDMLIRSIASKFIYGLTSYGGSTLSALSPAAYLTSLSYSSAANGVFPHLKYFLALLAAAVLFAVFAMLLYRSRGIESAGNAISHRFARPIFKYGFAAACSLVFGQTLFTIFQPGGSRYVIGNSLSYTQYLGPGMIAVFLVCMVIAGIIGYFAAEMMLRKSLRVFRRGWRGCAVFALAAVGLYSVICFDPFGLYLSLPKLEYVTSATLSAGNYGIITTSDPSVIAKILDANRIAAANRESNVSMISEINGDNHADIHAFWCNFSYTLPNGSSFVREYSLPASPFMPDYGPAAAVSALINNPEYIADTVTAKPGYTLYEAVCGGSDYLTFDGEKAAELQTALLGDILAGSGGGEDIIGSTSFYYNGAYASLTFRPLDEASDRYMYSVTIKINSNCNNLIAFLHKYGYDNFVEQIDYLPIK